MAVTFTVRPDGSVRFAVRVQPRASRTGIDGFHGEAVRVRVHAAPVDGAANAAVVAVLAGSFGLRTRDVRIVSGATGRQKVVEITGRSVAELEAIVNATRRETGADDA